MLKSKIAAAIAGSLLWVGGAMAQDTIKVGANLPMSGPNAELGEIFSRAASIAVKHINADKMLSKPVELAIEDSQATPQGGVVAMNKLVSVAKVPYVLSAYTAVSKAIAPIGDRAKVISINGGAVGPDLAELGDYFWNVIPLVNFEAEVLIPFVVKEKGLKNIVLIFVDDPLGEAVQKVLRAEVPKAGGKLVGELQVQRATQQFASIAANVRQLKPDAIYIASFGTQVNQIIKQLRDNGITQQLDELFGDVDTLDRGAPRSEGRLVHDAIRGLHRKRARAARREGIQGAERQGRERVRGELLQRSDGVRHPGAAAREGWQADHRHQPFGATPRQSDIRAGRRQDDVPAERHRRGAGSNS